MGQTIRVKMNSQGAAAILKSPAVEAELLRRAQLAADAAGGAPDFEASSRVGKNRVRASVITATREAREAEATDRALTRALDAARG